MKNRDGFNLLRKYKEGRCSIEEKALVEAWYHELKEEGPDPSAEEVKDARDTTWKNLVDRRKKVRRLTLTYRYAAVAAALVCAAFLVITVYTPADSVVDHPVIADQVITPEVVDDAVPGGNKAILTLADGSEVILDDVQNGDVAHIDKTDILKTEDGLIVYETSNSAVGDAAAEGTTALFNTITTPRGGQYRVILPDGTKVWLNSDSSLKYPVSFQGGIRSVELTGEAYFEVNRHLASDTYVPFVVHTRMQSVQVLGTRFNVNAYEDEPTVNTTLVEGRVRVVRGAGKISQNVEGLLLTPNHQALLSARRIEVREVDAEEMIAWKNGYFSFKHADIKVVMRQLSRWYDVEVVYEGQVPAGLFSGKVYRNINLSAVLEILAFSRVNFRIEGKKITIYS